MIPEELRESYWKIIRRTRTSGRVSASVIEKTEDKWKNFDEDVVIAALRTHISRYPGYRENYTLGIMRNMQEQKRKGIKPLKDKNWNVNGAYGKLSADEWEELEKKLLDN